MNVEVTRLPESRVTLHIELTPQEVDQALDRTYKQLVQRLTIPGFRKGKAPRPIVERMVGRELFLHEGTDEAVRWGYRKAVESSNLTPIDEAEIDTDIAVEGDEHDHSHGHVQPGEPFHFEASVTVRPDVQLPDLQSIHVDRPEVQVTSQDVDGLLKELQERNATLEPTIRSAQLGDVVTMNVVARVDGQEVINQDNSDFELRAEDETPDLVFPGLSAELVGANRGDIREINLHLPETYTNGDWAGKSMFLRTLIKEVKRKVLPALDDDFAQSVSEVQTLDELRDRLRENLEMERKLEADEQLVSQAIEAVTSRTFVEIPPVLVDEELDRMVDDMRRMFERQQLSFETYLDAAQQTEDDVRREMTEGATQNVKTSLVLGAIADAEGIQVTNREVDSGIDSLARSLRLDEGERRRLRSSTGARANIRSRLRRQRAIQRLVEIVTGGDEIAPEAAEAVADQTAAAAEDTEETVAVEIGG